MTTKIQTKNEAKKNSLYCPILKQLTYWRDYTGTGDSYRQQHDLDCVHLGCLEADTLISLWLPLRYSLDDFGYAAWEEWKTYEYEMLRPQNKRLKDCNEFLNDLIDNIEEYLPLADPLTRQLSELYCLGREDCNFIRIPYRRWNTRRGSHPYFEYFPHFVYDLLKTDHPLFLQAVKTWLMDEHLQMFFVNGIIDAAHMKDLAGTGAVWRHQPKNINLEKLLSNYIEILRERKLLMSTAA